MPCILTRCRAFILPGCNTAQCKRLQRVLPHQCNYTAHATKQRVGLYSGFSCDCARSTAHDTRPTQTAIIPPAPRWRVCQRPDALHRYQIPPPRRDAVQGSAAAYYNKVYKRVQGCACYGSMPDGAAHRRPCQPGGVSMFPTPGGWRSGTLHPAGQSGGRGGAAGGAEPLAATAASLFGLSPDS